VKDLIKERLLKMRFNVKLQLACLAIVCLHIWCSTGLTLVKRRLTALRCTTSTFVKASGHCRTIRARELTRKKHFYKISGPEKQQGMLHLDQPRTRTLGYFFAEKFHSHWFNLYFTLMLQRSNTLIVPYLRLKFRRKQFMSYDNYTQLSKEMKDVMLSATNNLPQFKYPSRSYEYFTDVWADDRFRKDEYFVQERLAGLNPMTIRRVAYGGNKGTQFGELLRRLNLRSFDWNKAVTSITGDRHIFESIHRRKVYVVEYPMLKDLTMMPDLLYFDRPNKKMKQHVAPIALFAVDPQKVLRVVAIQNTSSSDGHVHTPQSGIYWNISKAQVQISDGFSGQVVEHLMKTHFKMEPVCIALYRHLSGLHPLHQILKYHCRGLLPLNAQGTVTLLKEDRTIRSLFGYGNRGATTLLGKEYPKMIWGDIDLQRNVEERGMDDKEQLPYYPYRDDGRIINEVLVQFTNKLVSKLYLLDVGVRRDEEVQNMIRELSTKIRGFPSEVSTKQQLSKVVQQVLWIVVQHSMFSFPIAEYGHSPAIFPTKLYEGPTVDESEGFINMLPGSASAVLQGSLAHGLGTMHYDSMFDYWSELQCLKLRHVVKDAFEKMNQARKSIHNENKKRFERGQLTNPFMLQDWMPNSIST